MRDPEPCRIKHTEDTEQQTGWCLFFIPSCYLASSTSSDLDKQLNYKMGTYKMFFLGGF